MTSPIFTLPASRIKGVQGRFRLRPASLSSAQPFSGTRSVYGPIQALWAFDVSTAKMARRDWQWFSARFARAGGTAGLVRTGDPWRRRPLFDTLVDQTRTGFTDGTEFDDDTGFVDGYLPPFGIVDDAEVAGATSLIIAGLTPSLQPALYAGDLFEIRPAGTPADHGHLYEIVNDAPTNAGGKTRVNFRPELYRGVIHGDQVVLRDAMTVFRPLTDQEGVVERMIVDIGATGFSLIEERP